jgi:hypothetical protein
MVLAKLIRIAPALIAGCGSGRMPEDAGTFDAPAADVAEEEAADAPSDEPDADDSCYGEGVIDAGYWIGTLSCCGGKVCRGFCEDGGCRCEGFAGGCAPLYCCVYSTEQKCMAVCGPGH